MAVGLLDGLLGSIESIYDTGTGVFKRAASIGKYGLELTDTAIRRGALAAVFKLGGDAYGQARALQQNIRQLRKNLKGWIDDGGAKMRRIIEEMARGLRGWLGGLLDLEKDRGYEVGVLLFDVVLAAFSGGTTLGSKFLPQLYRWLERLEHGANGFIWEVLGYAEGQADEIPGLRGKISRCRILGKGCFVAGTPVLMAGAAGLAPVPIQEVRVDDMVKAYQHEETYLTASSDADDIYVPGWQNYDYLDITPETWQIGKFVVEEGDGSLVEIEANRPKQWFEDQEINEIGASFFLIMEEFGVRGKAELLELKPTDIDTRTFKPGESGMVDRPVITTFNRIAQEISDYIFSNGKTIGCTPNHPFYSLDRQAYVPIDELNLGETIQTAGRREVKFIGRRTRNSGEHVYNLEVWREHNYYVGSVGSEAFLLVHNICWEEVDEFFDMSLADKRKLIRDAYDAWFPQIFGRRSLLEGIMKKTKFVDWRHTFNLAENFRAIDFYKKTGGKNIVASMKTTKVENVQSWISQNSSHLQDLVDGKNSGVFSWGGNSIPADIVQLHLFTKKGLSAAERIAWENAIESYTGGKIQAIVEVIEESL
jgi:hypothetical protein